MSGWVFGPDVGLPDAGWMSQEEFLTKLNPPTTILPTVSSSGGLRAAPSWRVARSLDVLLGQVNILAPHRSKASDGSIGDAAHATRDSDHNPWYGPGIVTARDYTHDPANGLDCQKLADALVQARDPRVKYIIHNRRIIDSRPGSNPWRWMPYDGINPHTKHMHLSVLDNPSCDDIRPWALPGLTPGGDDMTPQTAQQIDEIHEQVTGVLNAWPGGITDDAKPPTPYNMLQHILRISVATNQTAMMVQKLSQRAATAPQVKVDVDRLAGKLAEHQVLKAPEVPVVDEVVSAPFWKASLERCLKTMVQTFLVLAVPSSGLFNAFSMDWKTTGGLALSAGLLSVLTSLASAPIGGTDSPSLLKGGE